MDNFLDNRQIAEILKEAQKTGADFAEIFIEDKHTCSINSDGGKIERLNDGESYGLGLRLISGEKVAYASTNDLNYENLLKIAQKTAQAIRGDAKEDRKSVV